MTKEMGIVYNGWTPSYGDIREELEELLSRAREEEERRFKAQEVIRTLWKEKLQLLYGPESPSAAPLYEPCRNEEVYLALHRFFDLCLDARQKSLEKKEPYEGALVEEGPQQAIKAHTVAIAILEQHQLRSKPLDDLLMLIAARSNQYALSLETVALMEKIVGKKLDRSLQESLITVLDRNSEAVMECYKLVKSCEQVKEGDEEAKKRRDELLWPTLIKYFPADQHIENLFRTLKIASEPQVSSRGYFSWW